MRSTHRLRPHPRRGDPLLGQALGLDCYVYLGAVLGNAHAGVLWRRFTTYLSRAPAAGVGMSRSRLRRELRVSYAKVAEYQSRSLVHLHAVVRLEGPTGADEPLPGWADLSLSQMLATAATSSPSPVTSPRR